MEFPLMYFSPVFDFIEKPVIWFAQQAYISTDFEAGLTKKIFFYFCAYLGQGIHEWTEKTLWKTAFKKFEVIWSA